MISTTEVIENLIKQKPFLEESLAEGIINYSSLARTLKPHIERKLMKHIQDGAIIMALKRVSKQLTKTLPPTDKILRSYGDIIIRSNLVDYTYQNSPTLGSSQDKILKETVNRKDVFITVSHGVSQVTIIASQTLEPRIKEIFKKETSICSIENLSSLTIKITFEATKIPGVLYSILKVLAWEGISIIECVSTFTELTIVLDRKDIDKAFSILQNYSQSNEKN